MTEPILTFFEGSLPSWLPCGYVPQIEPSILNYSLSLFFVFVVHTTMKVLFKKRQSLSTSITDDTKIPNREPASRGSSREIGQPQPDTRSDLGKRSSNHKNNQESCEIAYETLARRETKAVNVLRVLVLMLLSVTATITSVGVYLYTSNEEKQNFEIEHQANAERIIESFHYAVVRRLGAINSMATAITSYAIDANQTFPFVTIPHFEIRGSDLRVQADAAIIRWMPLVTDETRVDWEDYALANRYQVDKSFEEDAKQREKQDDEFGLRNTTGTGDRMVQVSQQETILDDETGYHPSIWSIGAVSPRGDELKGSGPYLPLWQRR
jgi:hypothetical protein